MEPVKCIFSVILPENQHQDMLNKYTKLEKDVINNNNMLAFDENEVKKYFDFSPDVKFEYCNIEYNKKDGMSASIVYSKKNKSLEILFFIKKYKFKFQEKIYYSFEAKFLKDYLEKEYSKKKFHLEIYFKNITEKIPKDYLFYFGYSNFEIVYNYNYKPVTLKELTKKNSYTNKKKISAPDLNYEFANYIELEEEDFNSFYYIDSIQRRKVINKIAYFSILNNNFIPICGPFGSGKTVTLLKMINNPLKRSFYINLWTVFNLEIDEVKNVLKYEYVKIIGIDFTKENENDIIISKIKEIDSSQKIYDFISELIIILNNMDENSYYLIIDQYSSKYDNKNQNIKKLRNQVKGTKIIMIICSSMNNDDVKENFAYSFSPLDMKINTNKINYLYIGSLIKLDALEEPLKSESIEFKKVLSEFGNLYNYYYKLKATLREKKDFERFIHDEENIIKQELENYYKTGEENKMKIELAKIIYYIKEKEIFLYINMQEKLLKLPLKFLEIKTQQIPIFKLMRFAQENNNFTLIQDIKKYLSLEHDLIEIKEESMTNFMNKGNAIDENEYSNQIKSNENRNNINIFYLEGLFPYIVDIFSKIIYNDNLLITRAFFSELSAQAQGGIIEFYLLEHIRYKKNFFGIKIEQFESIEVFVPNGFYFQNYSSRKKDTVYNYNEKKNTYFEKEDIKVKINLPKKNILIK